MHLGFILTGIFWVSWICCLLFLINFGKLFLSSFPQIILFCSPFVFSFHYLSYAYVTQFDIASQFLDALLSIFILIHYFLGISVEVISTDLSLSSLIFSLPLLNMLMSPSKELLFYLFLCFRFLTFPSDSLQFSYLCWL